MRKATAMMKRMRQQHQPAPYLIIRGDILQEFDIVLRMEFCHVCCRCRMRVVYLPTLFERFTRHGMCIQVLLAFQHMDNQNSAYKGPEVYC